MLTLLNLQILKLNLKIKEIIQQQMSYIFTFLKNQQKNKIEMSHHQNSINITQAGRKFMQMHNIPIQAECKHLQHQSISVQKTKGQLQLPHVSSKQSHECQLRQLPFRLNQLYKNNIGKYAEQEYNSSLNSLRNQLLRDLGYTNRYTCKKADQLATKILTRKQKQNPNNPNNPNNKQKDNMLMQLSKRRNYLTRINFLHNEQQNKYVNIRKILEKARNKQNSDIQ